jgi:hypothetical protein
MVTLESNPRELVVLRTAPKNRMTHLQALRSSQSSKTKRVSIGKSKQFIYNQNYHKNANS